MTANPSASVIICAHPEELWSDICAATELPKLQATPARQIVGQNTGPVAIKAVWTRQCAY